MPVYGDEGVELADTLELARNFLAARAAVLDAVAGAKALERLLAD
ncbi:hypothetical protein ACN9JG_02255 [Cereibacter azotoformans]